MSTGTYFSVKNAQSFSTKGIFGGLYYFQLGKAVPVSFQPDIDLFHHKSELFECDKDCSPIIPTKAKNNALSYTSMQAQKAKNAGYIQPFEDINTEETIQDALNFTDKKLKVIKEDEDPEVQKRINQISNGELTDAQKLSLGLIDEDGNDLTINEEEDEEEDEDEDNKVNNSNNKHHKKKLVKTSKNGKHKCEKCGKKFDDLEDLAGHMQMHEDDDE